MNAEERDKALIEHWRERHKAGTCDVTCYICVKKTMTGLLKETKKEGRFGTV